MVAYDWNPDRVRRMLRRDLQACRNCHVDITLKDVETVQGGRCPQPKKTSNIQHSTSNIEV
jgi:hypothetical protein